MCYPNPLTQALVSGISLILIFGFSVYLCIIFGKEIRPGEKVRYAGNRYVEESDKSSRIWNMCMYDPCFCIYTLLFIFFIGWMLKGFNLLQQISPNDPCRQNQKIALLLQVMNINNMMVVVFVVGGIIIKLLDGMVQSMQDGSCDCFDCCADCCCLFTLGCCDFRNKYGDDVSDAMRQ